ncbi:TonB-dependent receptor plug domain-containing protein [Marinifilum caeruleilacunae]|uniref:TonB-dependent receptor plug domain-containing protein n=1 Tax=Marinifilum caeruleilacunae TaxID=2499076 RepID=A0ABX1WQE8_9BACT|nr:TonB-dependent receptor plug domain-containing protein [Marinifilum caeruleilacunae]NOU58207.1 hypothetical protein [Marinifilum caeruleilacunae]
MKLKKLILSLVFILITGLFANAQNVQLSGRVLVFDSIPVNQANIHVLSSKLDVKTDYQGVFNIVCESKDKIIITADGFSKKALKVKKGKKIDEMINLKIAKIPNAQEIAIDKGHILQVDAFKSLAKKNSRAKDYSKYTTVMEILRNEFPSLQIVNGEIIIRGPSSFVGSSAAQIEIDGVMTTYSALDNLSPNNVASIQVIKGSDAAIYGLRGGNGVISIKTKRSSE